ncbi:hypothetical protein HMI54_010984 [Coelomomyces lativittatus]|nr:hypothetical protein HMI56_004019 [Coelomomyces lativittatus]KAJ1514724.1 hypothetical protein HMI55_004426 [Coelomomyces lativittatus]KAJ1516060.1 hypothetical protein HMI54_010984 [Coelomomyces lativittatus]
MSYSFLLRGPSTGVLRPFHRTFQSKATFIKHLRSQLPGVSLKLASQAYNQCGTDLKVATAWLQKEMLAQGLRLSTKQSLDNRLSQGWIGVFRNEHEGCMVEVNCQTDFVARTSLFCTFVQNMVKIIPTLTSHVSDTTPWQDLPQVQLHKTLTSQLSTLVSQVQEPVHLTRATYSRSSHVGMYLHPPDPIKQVGRLGALVSTSLHVPLHVRDHVAKLIVGYQPSSVVDLLNLPYHVGDPGSMSVQDVLLQLHQEAQVFGFRRYQVGESLEEVLEPSPPQASTTVASLTS